MGMQQVWVGVDVSAKKLQIAAASERRRWTGVVSNDAIGHRSLIKKLRQMGSEIFVGLEATGNYGLDLAVALHGWNVHVMRINPRAVAQFAKALLQRSKTDRGDADVILSFVQRMNFECWTPPSKAALQLRTLSRHIQGVKALLVEEKNRLHAAQVVSSTPRLIVSDLKRSIAAIEARVKRLEEECLEVIGTNGELQERFNLLASTVGYGVTSTIRVLAELAVLPVDMTARQWTAHAGLDPRQFESGTSVAKPERISKAGNRHLRGALYLPALTTVRCNANVRAFYDRLVTRGKKPKQAQVAVMRKMLHAIHAMFRTNSAFDGEKFYRMQNPAPVRAHAA
jgi:transposase